MSKIENEVNRSVTFCKRRSTLYKKASELLNDSTHLVAAHVRQKVNALNNKSEEIACIEEATSAQAHKLDKMKENGQKRWWESIETFNADEVAKFESWLIFADFSMKYHLKRLENKASSS
ncbi:hypothetical protein HAX54_028463 [Datura stramonium]|uniref:MADS-box domain-containing protein n=1 Tax=Datura stramonium TaxID=4076 RepID=A0ABS8RKS8_DATST|nr:hypothetical protein [Datura stramonium]